MAVVINELEVVVEPPPAGPPAAQAAPQQASGQAVGHLSPDDIEAVNRRLELYRDRVTAH